MIKRNTPANIMVFLTGSADHVAGAAGLTLAITASKATGAFASITPTVTDLGDGWYALALTAAHTDTLGDLALHITATGADPADVVNRVVTYDTDDVVTETAAGVWAAASRTLTAFGFPVPVAAGGITAASFAAGAIDSTAIATNAIGAAALAADAVAEIQAGLATAAALAAVDDFLDTEVAAILAAVDTEVAAIKAKTDALPADPASNTQVNTRSSHSAADAAAAVGALIVEGTTTLVMSFRGINSAVMGKASGLGTTTAVYRDLGDTKARLTATVDSDGNRTAITRDLT